MPTQYFSSASGIVSVVPGTQSVTDLEVTDDAHVGDDMDVDGDLNVDGSAVVDVNLSVGDRLSLIEAAGSHAATPTISFGDGDTGVYESADDTLNLVSEGVAVARINTGDQLIVLETPGSHVAAPSLAFGDGDTGFYEAADDFLVMGVGGVAHMQATASEVKPLVSFKAGASFGFENLLSPTGLTGNTDNWSPTNLASRSAVRMDSDGAYQLTGLGGANAGKFIFLMNISAFTITLMHDVTSTAENRFLCPGSVDFSLLANASVWLFYDTTSSRWRVLG